MGHRLRAWARSIAFLSTLAASLWAGPARALSIAFDSLAWAADGALVGDQLSASHGVRFGVDWNGDGLPEAGAWPQLTRVGSNERWAFVNDTPPASVNRAKDGYESQLGTWMLALPSHLPGPALVLLFERGMSSVAGDIWDIDGNPLQGTEQWRIDALGADGALLASIVSPIGETLEESGLNARPWRFEISRGASDIRALRIGFAGTKSWGIGAAFDGFAIAVPEPGTLALLVLGIAALARRRQRA